MGVILLIAYKKEVNAPHYTLQNDFSSGFCTQLYWYKIKTEKKLKRQILSILTFEQIPYRDINSKRRMAIKSI